MPERETHTTKPLATAAIEEHQREEESFSDFILRAAVALDAVEGGMDVTEPLRCASECDGLTEEVFREYIDDIAEQAAQKTTDEFELKFQ